MTERENWLRTVEFRKPEWIPCTVSLARLVDIATDDPHLPLLIEMLAGAAIGAGGVEGGATAVWTTDIPLEEEAK